MARIKSKQETVLTKIVDRLISQIAEFNSATCFLSVDADPDVQTDHNLWATVTIMDGTFGDGEFEGGAENAIIEYGGFSVNMFSRVALDQADHHTQLLTHETLGLLPLKHLVLKALTGHDLIINDGGDVNLANRIQPLNSPRPEYDTEKGRGVLTIHFGTDIDWDLT